MAGPPTPHLTYPPLEIAGVPYDHGFNNRWFPLIRPAIIKPLFLRGGTLGVWGGRPAMIRGFLTKNDKMCLEKVLNHRISPTENSKTDHQANIKEKEVNN